MGNQSLFIGIELMSNKTTANTLNPKSERINGISYEAHYVDIESTKLIPAENVNRIAVRHLFYEL